MTDLDGARRVLGMARKDIRALQGVTDSATFADEMSPISSLKDVGRRFNA